MFSLSPWRVLLEQSHGAAVILPPADVINDRKLREFFVSISTWLNATRSM
jgi:hypothetical protein